jgi:hypothetical protein
MADFKAKYTDGITKLFVDQGDGTWAERVVATSGASSSGSATGTQTSVANATSSGTLLAASSARKGAAIYNDDNAATLKIKLGAAASATSFTYAIAPGGYYEVPFSYTGIITGIASAATGNARVTEVTA